MPNEGVQGNQGKVRDMHVAHELSGKSQEIQLILGNIREIYQGNRLSLFHR